MSEIKILRRTYIKDDFRGEKYFSQNELNTLTNSKPNKFNKEETAIVKKKYKPKKQVRSIPYKTYVLNNIFKLWLKDNMGELEESFEIIIGIHEKNMAEFPKNKVEMFRDYASMLFRSNQHQIQKDYS